MHKSSNPLVVRKLQTVGISTFIKYYHLYKSQRNEKSNEVIFEEFRKNKEPWNDSSCQTKASQGKSIFNHNLDKQVLEYIINETNVNKIGVKVHERALELYRKEY